MDRLLLKKNAKILGSTTKKVKMLLSSFIIFLKLGLPSLFNRTKGQLKFPAREEDLAPERVVEVVVHAKQQIRIVTQTVNVAEVPAINNLTLNNLTSGSPIFFHISLRIQKIFIRKCSNFTCNPRALPGSPKFRA